MYLLSDEALAHVHDVMEPAINDPEYARKSVSSANWLPDKGVAEVFEQKGKLLQRMGFIQEGNLHLHIEEAIYIMERGQLRLYSSGDVSRQLLTLQQAFNLMITGGVTKDQYLVYSHLMEASLIVRRHPVRWHVAPSEHPCQVWGGGVWTASCPQDTQAAEGPQDSEQELPLREPKEAFLQSCLPQQPSIEGSQHPAECQQSSTGEQSGSGRAAKRQKLEEGALPVQRRTWWPCMAADDDPGGVDASPRVTVVDEAKEDSCTPGPPHLQPFRSIPSGSGAAGAAANIAFDVHKPNSGFSRKKADPPVVSVCMIGAARPPSRAEMAAAEAAGTGDAAACCAYVSHTDVALYAFAKVELPNLLTTGNQQPR